LNSATAALSAINSQIAAAQANLSSATSALNQAAAAWNACNNTQLTTTSTASSGSYLTTNGGVSTSGLGGNGVIITGIRSLGPVSGVGLYGGSAAGASNSYSNSNSYSSGSNSGNSNCNNMATSCRGSGPITYMDSNYMTVGGNNLYFGPCTNKSYQSGRNSYSVADKVSYEGYASGGKNYARNITCTN